MAQAGKKTVAELREELRQAEALEATKLGDLRKNTPVQYRYTIMPNYNDRTANFDKVYDSTCLSYVIKRWTLNAIEAKAAGHGDHSLRSGSMTYMYNTVTGKIICAVGGGTSFIGPRFGGLQDRADDQAFSDIGKFLRMYPDGGDITSIVDEFLAVRKLTKN